MSDLKKIDDKIKQGINREYPMDEKLWGQAEQQLDTLFPVKGKKKGLIFISVAFLAIVTTIYGVTTYIQKDKSTATTFPVPTISAPANTSITTNTSNTNHDAEITPKNDQVIDSKTEALVLVQSNNQGEVNKSQTEPNSMPNAKAPLDKGNAPEQIQVVDPGSKQNQINGGDVSTTRPQTKPIAEPATVVVPDVSNVETPRRIYGQFENITIMPKVMVEDISQDAKSVMNESPTFMKLPKRQKWFISVETEVLQPMKKQQISLVENGLNTTLQSGVKFGLKTGVMLGKWTISSGIGQSSFSSNYTGQLAPTPRIDTISSYYALVTNEYKHYEKVVTLIERRYNTETVFDSNDIGVTKSGTSQIRYLTVPLSIGYTRPFNRFEWKLNVQADIMFSPSFKHAAPSEFSDLLKNNEEAIRTSLIQPSVDVGMGYRFNNHFSGDINIRKSLASKSILTSDPNNLDVIGLRLSLTYRF